MNLVPGFRFRVGAAKRIDRPVQPGRFERKPTGRHILSDGSYVIHYIRFNRDATEDAPDTWKYEIRPLPDGNLIELPFASTKDAELFFSRFGN